ncbi:MAG: hypothetical protein JWM96_1079 [Alphaproteobacteria bacterium]|nr:hypothetical protein [Alphaproteobacteria bacterium]
MRNRFDIVMDAPPEIMQKGDAIHSRYFTIDTADLDTFYQWYALNPHIVTYAVHENDVTGYFCILPISGECAALFDQQAIKEEDLSLEHLIPLEVMHHAQFAYIGTIAIKDNRQFLSRQCAAALMAGVANHFLQDYNPQKLKRLYANPTTFNGNHMVRKLGLKPVVTLKKPLTGNDIYAMDVTDETLAAFAYLSQRYGRFIGENPWGKLQGEEKQDA